MDTIRIGRLTIITFFCLAGILIFFRHSLAFGPHPPGPSGNSEIVMKHMLELTSEQVEAIQAIKASYREQMAENRKALQSSRETFKQSLDAQPTESEIRGAFAPVAEAMTEMEVDHALMMQQIKLVLTDEQNKKAEEFQREMSSAKHERPVPERESNMK